MLNNLKIALTFKSTKETIEVEDITKFLELFGDKYIGSIRRNDNKGVMLHNKEKSNSIKIEIDRLIVEEKYFDQTFTQEVSEEIVEVLKIIDTPGMKALAVSGDIIVDNETAVSDIIIDKAIKPEFKQKFDSLGEMLAVGLRNIYSTENMICDIKIEPLLSDISKFVVNGSIISKENVETGDIAKFIYALFEHLNKNFELVKCN